MSAASGIADPVCMIDACWASEIAGLEWERVDLARKTAWLNRTKNAMSRGVPLNADALAVLKELKGNHAEFCFTYRAAPIRWEVTNTAWHNAIKKAGLTDVRFHDLRPPWAPWHGKQKPAVTN